LHGQQCRVMPTELGFTQDWPSSFC